MIKIPVSAQEVFDKVAAHLLTQDKRSTRGPDILSLCMYKTSTGLKCAAGCLIPDEEYCPSFEGSAWNILVESKSVENNNVDLIVKLQYIHDKFMPGEWKGQLTTLAKELNLEINFQ